MGPERELQNGILVERLAGMPALGRPKDKPFGKKPFKADNKHDKERPAKAHAARDGKGDRPQGKPWAKKDAKRAPEGGAPKKKFKPKRKGE